MRVCEYHCGVTLFVSHFIKAVEDFSHVFIASSKHLGKLGEFSKVMKPLTANLVCITVLNSPNSPLV